MQNALQECKRLLHYSTPYALCMTSSSERLRFARERAGFKTAVEAADALGVARSTYIGHENGHRGFPASRAPQYARKFKVSEEWLLYGKGDSQPLIDGAEGIIQFPILGDVPAGNWKEAIHTSRNMIPVPASEAPAQGYALKVHGDSMDLVVPDGTMIVVDPGDTDLWAGKCYVIMNDDGETTFKRYLDNPARLVPCSSNPSHKEMPIQAGGYQVLGRVVWQGGRL
jgi:SOS-response transcriptional repressor LexA